MSDEFGGRVINGEVTRYSEQKPQDDPQVFLDALDVLLATPGVEAVRWNQYTPYFNDGEVCVFHIYGALVRIAGDGEQEGEYGNGFRSTYDLYDYDLSAGGSYETRRVFNPIAGFDSRVIHEAIIEFEGVLENGRHYVVLNTKFGDPAEVTATPEGFNVEFHDHE